MLIGACSIDTYCLSPEIVAKLGHDYTVYAYDFSEYETPLVGQGMLSWILASASNTPNAPAEDSQTMVTGRVCNNLTVFGQGMKETLEVKLKMVPVPTSLQKEYVENMERYHSLSQLMPETFDYNAWSDFLKENPTLNQLAQPMPAAPAQPAFRSSIGGIEPFHQMLTRNSPSQEPTRTDPFFDQSNMSFQSQQTRASSPAMSTMSFHHYQYNADSRPASRASVRSEAAPPHRPFEQSPAPDLYVIEQQEEGPPKKRARITQTKRPKKTPLTAHNDSLRVTASTAASVRLHRPIAANPAAALASAESIPRAPTPRPGDTALGPRGPRRPPAPSALRHASIDEGRPYMSPYDANTFSDNAMESADERGGSPGDTPLDIPSSPPIAQQRTVSPAPPSSPTLPTLPFPDDSGFVSDMPLTHDEDGIDLGSNIWDGSDLPFAPEPRPRRPNTYNTGHPWQEITPGPVDRLPQTYVPRPKRLSRKSDIQPITQSIEENAGSPYVTDANAMTDDIFFLLQDGSIEEHAYLQANAMQEIAHEKSTSRVEPTDSYSFEPISHQLPENAGRGATIKTTFPEEIVSHVSPLSEADLHVYSRSATPNPLTRKPKPSKSKGLTRSQTWSGAEPMSDAPTPCDLALPRSGSGARRKKYIKDKMEQAIAAGEMPPHCQNCGEIDTPTWRKAYTRIEYGSPEGVEISTDTAGTGIIAIEVVEPSKDSGHLSYRVFKNNVTRQERESNLYETLNLCNPCGLWLIKKASMRPQKLWDKSERGTKRKRQATAARTKSLSQEDELMSDAVVPHSEPIQPVENAPSVVSFDDTTVDSMPPPAHHRSSSAQLTAHAATLDQEAAEEALRRAIQSSPAGFRGSKNSPIDLDTDLTPNPTRRLLFPSPRKSDESKSLTNHAIESPGVFENVNRDEVPEKPRCERCKERRRRCDRERPCGRCVSAGIGIDGCIPCKMPRTNWFETPVVQMATVDQDNPDKENCPPLTANAEVDDLAHLFEDPVSPKTTPKRSNVFQDFLKTPTPGSRHRDPLTPRRCAENTDHLRTPSRMTPSRNILTPRGTRATTAAPDTPFTRQLNALLSDCNYSSPSQGIDFSAFPSFNTPGRSGAQFGDFIADDFLSSDMPMPSSPSKSGVLGLGFDLYEDPNTATMGLWSGASMFGSDALLDLEGGAKHPTLDLENGSPTSTLLKMHVGGVTVDFAAMMEDIVGADEDDVMNARPVPDISEDESQGLVKTPDAPAIE
jgi:hypothetical protein